MLIERKWAMPNKETFKIKPITKLLKEEICGTFPRVQGLWCDPFAGNNSPAQITNDLNPETKAKYHLDALDFLKKQKSYYFDGVLLDPPYSPRQVSECYRGFGKEVTNEDTRMSFWSKIKNEIERIVHPYGKVISFGWSSMGMGKSRGFKIIRIMLIPHGGNKNDTIVTVEKKMQTHLGVKL